MSRRWEAAIQEWYTKSPTANLEYLDLAKTEPTSKELAHNLAVIYDRVNLSSRVHLRNFKLIQEEIVVLKEENQKLIKAVKSLTKEVIQEKPLTEKQVKALILETFEQNKLIIEEALATFRQLKEKIDKLGVALNKIEDFVNLLITKVPLEVLKHLSNSQTPKYNFW